MNSHVHITFGDYTPRQRTVHYLDSCLFARDARLRRGGALGRDRHEQGNPQD